MSLFPMTFPKCPVCHYPKTVCLLVCQEEGKDPSAAKWGIRAEFTPIVRPDQITTPLVKGVLSVYDICAKCGLPYCVRVELMSLPLGQVSLPGQMPPNLTKAT